MRQLPTDPRAQRRQPRREDSQPATATDGAEVIELHGVARPNEKARGALALAVIVGAVAITGLLLGRTSSTDPATALSSPTPAPAESTVPLVPTPAPTPRPQPTRQSPEPLLTPDFPSWRWEPLPIGPLAGEQATVSEIWSLPDRFIAGGYTRVATGEDNVLTPFLITSTDGRGWDTVPMPTRDFRPEAGVVVDGALWLVGYVGGDPFDVVDSPRQAWTTADGAFWTRVDGLDGLVASGSVVRVAIGAQEWLAVVREVVVDELGGESVRTAVRRSTDGTQWSDVGDTGFPDDGELVEIATDGSRWVMLVTQELDAGSAAISTRRSDDGVTWIDQPLAEVEGGARDITYGRAGFLVVGSDIGSVGYEPQVWGSPHGVRWTQRPAGTFGSLVPVEMTRVVPAGRGYLAIAAFNGQAWYSDDGEAWENFEVFTNASPRIDAVAVRGDLIVAAADGGFDGYQVLLGNIGGMHR